MIPVVLGLAALAAKAAGLAAIPRLVKALTASLQRPDFPLTQAPSNKAPTAISSGIVEPTALSSPKAALLEGPSIPENQPENALPTVLRGPATRPVVKEYNHADGSVKASYFLGATGRQAIKVNGVWYIYLKDTHGSVTGMVDTDGNRVATYENGDYGEPIVDSGSVYNPYRWNGEQTDAESGLTYMRNRYYQASTGRFIQRDPISYAGGLNLYAYCGGDPVNSADPSGLGPTDEALGLQADRWSGRDDSEYRQRMAEMEAYENWYHNQPGHQGLSDVSFSLLGDYLTGKALGFATGLPAKRVLTGSGPAAGYLEVSAAARSTKAVQSFSGSKPVDFVFNSETGRFVMGRGTPAEIAQGVNGHSRILKAANMTPSKNIVGGQISRQGGRLVTNEWSGHFGENWTGPIRQQFVRFMSESGVDVTHSSW